jgi:hypothetical protein
VLEGVMVSAGEIEVLNQLVIFKSFNVAGWFSVPILNLEFFTVGIPRLFTWDYSFFGGNAGIIQYALYSVTAAASFGLLAIGISVLFNYFGRR